MLRQWVSLLLLALPPCAHASGAWVENLIDGPLTFEMVTEANYSEFDLRTAGEFRCGADPGENSCVQIFADSLAVELARIQARRGRVVIDCLLFAQVAAIYKMARENQPSLLLPFGTSSPTVLLPFLFNTEFVNVALSDWEAARSLQLTHFANKSQWLIPIASDLYVGLSDAGVKVQTGREWRDEVREGLYVELARDEAKYCDHLLDPTATDLVSRKVVGTRLVQTLRALNRLGDYTLRELSSEY